MKIFLSVVFTTICSFSNAQESPAYYEDSTTTSDFNFDSISFIFRTDVLDLLSTLIEEKNFSLTVGMEFILTKKYSIRLQARTDQASSPTYVTSEFRSGPEVIKYFAENISGSFYGGVFLEYYMYKIIKYESNFSTTRIDQFFSPGVTVGYSYSAAKHFIIEPTLRIGYGDRYENTLLNARIGLYVGYTF